MLKVSYAALRRSRPVAMCHRLRNAARVEIARRQAQRLVVAGTYAGQIWLSASAGYLLVLLVAGRKALPSDLPACRPTRRVVVLVPSHDEEVNVARAVEALRSQGYPPDLLDVVVVADNFADTTASVAAAAEAVAWERHAPDAPGKGRVLAWALERLWHELPATDVVLIVDADCVASPNLCSTVVSAMVAGGTRLLLDALVRVPAFAAGRLYVLGRVASGRGAQTWVRTARREETREYAAG